jgi:hypothetical protein
MHIIPLTGLLSFAVEQEEKGLRLIVFKGDDELVCHKANHSELIRFIKADTGHLFKGRLQLDKKNDYVIINVKGSTAGIISLTDFNRQINCSEKPQQITQYRSA